MAAYFHRTATGVIADNLMREFSIQSASELGLLSSMYFYIYAIMQMPAGILADTWGPRRTVSLAMLVAALGAFIFGLADSLTGIYLGRCLATLGISVIYVSIVKIYAEWFRLREFGTMSGVIVIVANTGMLVSATPLAFAVDTIGWRSSFHLIGVYSVVMAVICWLIVRDRPTEVGLPSIAAVEAQEEAAPVARPETAADTERVSIGKSVLGVVSNGKTWGPFFAAVSIYGVYMAFVGIWGVPYFMQIYGMNRVDASGYMMYMPVGNMVGASLVGFASDRLGLRKWPYFVYAVFFLGVWLALTCWGGAKPPIWALPGLCFLIGVGMSGITLCVACIKEVNSPRIAGIAAGIANSAPFVGAAAMQPAFGWVLDRYWQGAVENGVRIYPLEAYQNAFWFCAAVLVVGVVSTLLIKETKCCNVWVDGKKTAC